MVTLSRFCQYAPLALVLVLAGCGGSSNGDSDPPEEQVDYSHLQWSQESAEPLSNEHDSEAVADYLRNGLRLQLAQRSNTGDTGINQPTVDADNAAAESSADGAGFSTTNVHVAGVEEADRLKYDGRHLFVAESPQFSFRDFASTADIAVEPTSLPPQQSEQALRIYRTDPDNGDASPVARYRFDREEDTSWRLTQLYTLGEPEQTDSVVALSEGGSPFAGPMPEMASSLPYYNGGSSRVELVDVRSPANPALAWTLEVEGQLVRSRKVGDILYLVSRSGPRWPSGLALEDGASVDNEQRIEQAGLESLLPVYRIDGGVPQPLAASSECYLPQSLEPDRAHRQVLTVAAFDLRQRERVSAACVSAPLSGLYMSPRSLYLASSSGQWGDDSRTALHKFAVGEGEIDYRGTGVVPGYLQSSDPAFNLDEDGEYLRVVATQRSGSGDFDHRLLVLREGDEQNLELVAQLPNEQQPDSIGKPGESIYAVRFLGDRAYLVTFRRIDPLYALDLSDNEQPRVIGELEIPGVSNYLHPVEEGYLVSVGREADEDGRVLGIKIELFDVRDDNPASLASHIIGSRGSWSQALHDLKAFSFLRVSDDQLRFAVPISRSEDYDWQDSGLHLFEVNNLSGETARLDPAGELIAESRDSGENYPLSSGSPRSRLHDESLFYLHGDDLWAGFWDEPEAANGPIGF